MCILMRLMHTCMRCVPVHSNPHLLDTRPAPCPQSLFYFWMSFASLREDVHSYPPASASAHFIPRIRAVGCTLCESELSCGCLEFLCHISASTPLLLGTWAEGGVSAPVNMAVSLPHELLPLGPLCFLFSLGFVFSGRINERKFR